MKSPLSLEELLTALSPGSRVLDLGCGGGTFQYSGFSLLQIFGFDERVHENVRKFPANAHFVCAGASALPNVNGVFDLIIVNCACEHCPDPVAALSEIDRVAKDRAYVWMSMPNAGSFEDQLYRNLFAGGGHLQSPTLERFVRLIYAQTSLKLVSLLDLPAGFTWLGGSEELRHLTWAIIDALKKSAAINAQSRSGYTFVLQKFAEAGPGYREFLNTCFACGSPDGIKSGSECGVENEQAAAWTCPRCGARNSYPSSLQAVQLDDVARAMRLQWERFPETHPARLREMVDERGRWGRELERQLESLRQLYAQLQAEFDQRGRWALDLSEELARLKTFKGYLKFLWNKLGRLPR